MLLGRIHHFWQTRLMSQTGQALEAGDYADVRQAVPCPPCQVNGDQKPITALALVIRTYYCRYKRWCKNPTVNVRLTQAIPYHGPHYGLKDLMVEGDADKTENSSMVDIFTGGTMLHPATSTSVRQLWRYCSWKESTGRWLRLSRHR